LILVEAEPLGGPDDPRQARIDALADLPEAAAEPLVMIAAPGDVDAMARAVAAGEQHFGALHGVLHAAGAGGAFQPLTEIDAEATDAHFRARIHPLLALDAALAARGGPAPDFHIVLSSLASVLGGLGQGLPTAADQCLDAFAEASSRVPWRSLDWDVWQPEGEGTELRADLARLAMTAAQGEEAFRRALGVDVDRLLVSTGALGERIAEQRRRIRRRRGEGGGSSARGRHQRPELVTPFAAPESDMEQRIAEVWQDFLGLEGIGIHDNFFDLGGDSFVAVQVATRLKEVLETDLPVARLYQHLTVRSLAESLAQSTAEAAEEKASHLAERRESMDRRKRFQERRRARKTTS
jgi:acyl carrier protein